MSDVVAVAVVAALAPTLAVVLTWWQSRTQIKKVNKNVDGRMSELLSANTALRKELKIVQKALKVEIADNEKE